MKIMAPFKPIVLQTGQTIGYVIKKSSTGARFVHLTDGRIIPADIAKICVGRDRWLSQIRCKCRDCGESFTLSDLGGGGQWCEPCATKDVEERDREIPY